MMEEFFLRREADAEPIKMTGEAFILLFQALRKKAKEATPTCTASDPEMSEESPRPKLDGLRFLWHFFSNDIPEHLERSISRRIDEIKSSFEYHQAKEDAEIEDLFRRIQEKTDADSEISSVCSSISYVTASNLGNYSPSRRKYCSDDRVVPSSPVFLGGLLVAPEEKYLETPPSSSRSSINGDGNVFEKSIFSPVEDARDILSWQRAHDYFEDQDEHQWEIISHKDLLAE